MPMFRQTHVEHLLFEYIHNIIIDNEIAGEHQQLAIKKMDSNEKELQRFKRELDAVKTRMKKWQYMFVNDLLDVDSLRERLNEESIKEREALERIEAFSAKGEESEEVKTTIRNLSELWSDMDDLEKQEVLRTVFSEITLHTNLENVKGVKNKYFESSIQVKYR